MILLLVFALVLCAGCKTRNSFSIPPCPAPTDEAVNQVSDLVLFEEGYGELLDWISEIDRYCNAVDSASRGGLRPPSFLLMGVVCFGKAEALCG